MLEVFDGAKAVSRRRMLSIGSLAFGGLALGDLLRIQADTRQNHPLTGKSVIFLFQQGGPSQHETFDPKPEAPEAVRTVTDTIQTKLGGVRFGSTMEQLAQRNDKFTVVCSFQTRNGGHNIQPIVGSDSLDTNIGVHYARIAGTTRADSGMPTNAVIYPASVSDQVPKPQARGNLSATGSYGGGYAPFIPGAGGQLQKDMSLNTPRERLLNARRPLLNQLDRMNRQADVYGQLAATDDIQDQAYQLLLGGGVSAALDLSLEDPRIVEAYDTCQYSQNGKWNRVSRGRAGYYSAQAESIGKLLLLARRLCQAGCGFVTIHAGYAGVWDMHADGNNLNMTDGMEAVGRSFDHAVAAFIDDLERQGLQNDILLVATGEMGRTPRINKNGGRDHWSKLAPLFLYGAGIPRGQIIGQSTRDAGEPSSDGFHGQHLISTILNTLLDAGELRITPAVPPQIGQLLDHSRIV